MTVQSAWDGLLSMLPPMPPQRKCPAIPPVSLCARPQNDPPQRPLRPLEQTPRDRVRLLRANSVAVRCPLEACKAHAARLGVACPLFAGTEGSEPRQSPHL